MLYDASSTGPRQASSDFARTLDTSRRLIGLSYKCWFNSTAQSWLNVVGARMSNVRISCPTLGLVTLAESRCASSLTHISPVFPAEYLYFTTSLPIEGLIKLPARILFLRNLASLQQNVGVRQQLPLAPRLIGRIEQQGPRDESCRMDPENLEALHARCMSGRPRRHG